MFHNHTLLDATKVPFVTAVGGAVTWAAPSAHVALSGSNLVATSLTGTTSGDAARSTTSHTTGKYYLEVTFTTDTGTAGSGVGLIGSTFAIGPPNFVGGNTNSICAYSSGSIFYNGGTSGWAVSAMTTGDIWCLAIDLDFRKLWVRKNNLIWGGSLGWDPATNVGGESISTLDSAVYVACDFQDVAGCVFTANFAGPFTFTAPSGFVAW